MPHIHHMTDNARATSMHQKPILRSESQIRRAPPVLCTWYLVHRDTEPPRVLFREANQQRLLLAQQVAIIRHYSYSKMKLLQSALLLISSGIAFIATQDVAAQGTCVFPVKFYVSNQCNEFWGQPVTNITADGECHYVPPSQYTDMIGPGPYYRAVCSPDGGSIQYVRAGCSESTCTNCPRFSAYINGTSRGVFDMTNLQCQDLTVSSFVSYGPLDVRAEPEPVPVPVVTPTFSPTVTPVAPPIVPPTAMPVTAAPVAPVVPCEWYFRYYNRTYSPGALPTCSDNIYNLIGAQQRTTIIADGQCHDSGISSLGFYQAMCDGSGSVVFIKNKCLDATCEVCDADSDVYTGTGYASNVCRDHDSSPLKAWVLRGTCSLPSCAGMTRAATTSSFSLSSSP